MSGSVPMITTGSISEVTGLTRRPVYFLKLNNSPTPNLVVKGEKAFVGMEKDSPGIVEQANISIKWGSKLMKNVQHRMVNTKLMTHPEIIVFKAKVARSFAEKTPQYQNGIMGTYNWVKMPFVPGVSDADMYDEATGNVLKIKGMEVIGKLADERIWNDLGIVLAVDIFIGNNDRFDIETGYWRNHGNFMLLDDPNSAVIGLDTFDPCGAYTQSNLVIGKTYDALKSLTDPVQRLDFAQKCAKSVGEVLGQIFTETGNLIIPISIKNENGDVGTCYVRQDEVENLYLPYAPALAQGIEIGATRLKQYLNNKITRLKPPPRPNTPAPHRHNHFNMPSMSSLNPFGGKNHHNAAPNFQKVTYGLPPAIEERMRYLGWIL
jgi:hypothetical protein